MALSDWNLEANEEAGQARAMKKCTPDCDEDMAKNGFCHRYCDNGKCGLVDAEQVGADLARYMGV